jgi:hypothetical protein
VEPVGHHQRPDELPLTPVQQHRPRLRDRAHDEPRGHAAVQGAPGDPVRARPHRRPHYLRRIAGDGPRRVLDHVVVVHRAREAVRHLRARDRSPAHHELHPRRRSVPRRARRLRRRGPQVPRGLQAHHPGDGGHAQREQDLPRPHHRHQHARAGRRHFLGRHRAPRPGLRCRVRHPQAAAVPRVRELRLQDHRVHPGRRVRSVPRAGRRALRVAQDRRAGPEQPARRAGQRRRPRGRDPAQGSEEQPEGRDGRVDLPLQELHARAWSSAASGRGVPRHRSSQRGARVVPRVERQRQTVPVARAPALAVQLRPLPLNVIAGELDR